MVTVAAHWKRVSLLLVLLVLVLPGFVPFVPPPGAQAQATLAATPEAIVNDDLAGMTLVDTTLFWYSDCGGEFNPVRTRIRRTETGGSLIRSLFFPATCSDDRVVSTNLAIDEAYVYWVAANGRVLRLPRGAGTTDTPTVIATAATSWIASIAVDSQYVYWSIAGTIYRAPKTGGSAQSILTYSSVHSLKADREGRLYYIADGSLYVAFPLPDGVRYFPGPISRNVSAYTLDGDQAFWASNSGIFSINRITLRDRRIHYTLDSTGDPSVPGLTTDARNIYWFERRSGSTTVLRLARTAAAGTAPDALTDNPVSGGGSDVATDGRYLYWSDFRSILRLPVTAAAVTLDLRVDTLEVVQAIQRPANDVPLVAGKETYARISGRIVSSSAGLTSLRLWPPAQLFGTDAGGNPLPGSPLSPLNSSRNPPLLNRAADRTVLDESYLFRLPAEWTRGDVTLRAEINPRRVVRETSYANNSMIRTINFANKAPACLVMVPYKFRRGTSIASLSRYRSYSAVFNRARSLLPVSDIWTFWPGGSPRGKFFSGNAFEVSTENGDGGYLIFKINVDYLFSSAPRRCNEAGAETFRVAMLPDLPPPGRQVNGMAGGKALLFFLRSSREDVLPANSAISGVTLAHEMGHLYGRGHIDCPPGEPDGVDRRYPYPTCQLDTVGPNAHIGFDPISRSLVLPDRAGDLMSYAHFLGLPRWTSDYTWRAIFSRVRTRASTATTMAALTYAMPASAPLLVSGMITPDSNQALLTAAYDLTDPSLAEVLTRLAELPTVASPYELWIYDAGDTLVQRVAIPVIEVEDHEHDMVELPFFVALDAATTPARIEVRDPRTTPSVLLGQLAPGPGVPTVTLVEPTAGTNVGDTLTVRWNASDPDGDPLSYIVRYSPDNGATWQTLATGIADTAITVSTEGLAGSVGQSWVQVLASDGLHSAVATSAPFSLQLAAPQAVIHNATPDITAAHGEIVILQGHGYDDEDGVLIGSALQWQVSGPVTRNGDGEQLTLFDLPPGAYDVTLTATDTTGQTGIASARLYVTPKYVADGVTPVLDGLCDDDGYNSDSTPITLRYASGETAEIRMIRAEEALYTCFSGMPVGAAIPGEFVGLRIDVDNSGGSVATVDDRGFFVGGDGVAFTAAGDGAGGFTQDGIPQGLSATVSRDESTWSAELRIDAERLGAWNRAVRMKVSHYQRTAIGDDTAWPSSAVAAVPSTWGTVLLGANPTPQIDTLNPSQARSGDADFTLTITGRGFVPGAVARWADADLPTRFVSETELAVSVVTADLASSGAVNVIVVNPAPGGGPSNAQSFTIREAVGPTVTPTPVGPTATPTPVGPTVTPTPTPVGPRPAPELRQVFLPLIRR